MKFFLLLVLLIFGCAKNSEISAGHEPQQRLQSSSLKLNSDSAPLVVTFDETDVIANRGDLVHLHLLLSAKVEVPVVVTVILTGSSGGRVESFAGFVSGNPSYQKVVIEPNTKVGHIAKIAIKKQALCGQKLHLLQSDNNNQLLVFGEPVTIQINCPQ